MKFTHYRSTFLAIGLLITLAHTINAQYALQQYVWSNGNTTLTDENVTISGSVGQPLIGVGSNSTYTNLAGFWYPVVENMESCLLGDANGDAIINISDIVLTIGYIFDDYDETFSASCADCNHDGLINVVDIVCMVDYILNRN
ncbi:MAG: hypothetical protein HQ510_01760 [Candidatus Marinimicrobia bacterium]|nr:hypothetical protein [Candidatus Neomarinimicrobiota bacterium]